MQDSVEGRIRAWECQRCGAVRLDAVKIPADPEHDHWSADEWACIECGSLVMLVVTGLHCDVCGRLVRASGHEHAAR